MSKKRVGEYESRIQELLGQMTLEEKVGQLRQCGPSLVGAFDVSFEELLDMMFDGRISEEEFGRLMSTAERDFREEDLRAGRIGSYNGVGDAETANRLQRIAVEETRLGIPLLFGYDVVHGFRTVTPIPLAESCAWEPELWERTARMAAEEASAAGVHMTFAPMVDVAKDARWGRISEGAGEDTLLNAAYGAAKVRGFQGGDLAWEDSLVACVKHFAAYGAVEAGRDYNRVDMSPLRLWEDYLPSYQACVAAGAMAVMPAFNDINGVPCSVNRDLLTDILRGQWGFEGMTVSDANAIAECVDHGIAQDRAEAAALAIHAGMDMDMTSDVYAEELVDLVSSGKVDAADLDRAVADVLRVKFACGLFDDPYKTSPEREAEMILRPEYRELAREAAVKSIVLLKNEDGILPLAGDTKVALAGDLAFSCDEMMGPWAVGGIGSDCVSLEEGLKFAGISLVDTEDCDVIIAAVGETKDMSGEAASRADISIPEEQICMLEDLLETGKPVIAVVFGGRPLAMPWVAEHVPAVVEAWFPGVEAGNALADILFGEVNPSAKLTATFPYATGQCPLYYAHTNTGRPGGKGKFTSKYLDTPLGPLYPFGYGLSYTTFAYSDPKAVTRKKDVTFSVTVTNTGSCEGDEIVQCYFRQHTGARVRPVKQLAAFEKIRLSPGEERRVGFTIPYEQMSYYDSAGNIMPPYGTFTFFAGGSSVDCVEDTVEVML